MKKHLIAAAVAGAFAVPAMAQVTVYGIVDAGYQTNKVTSGSTTVAKSAQITHGQSNSRIGFKGEEDLGGGLKATFNMEYNLAHDEDSAPGGNRLGFIGLTGGFGTIQAGRLYTLLHSAQGARDPSGNPNAITGWLPNLSGLNAVRMSDAVLYTSPSISGFTVQVGMGLVGSEVSTAAGATKAGDMTTFGASYAAGPLSVSFATMSEKRSTLSVVLPGATAATAMSNDLADRDQTMYGASYDLGVAKVSVLFNEAEAGTAADKGEISTTSLGVSVPFGAVTLAASMSEGDYKDSGARKVDLSGTHLAAYYALSKRTNVYAVMGEAKNKATTAGKTTVSTVGLRHQF